MIFLLIALMGVISLVATILAKSTNNPKNLMHIIRRKENENDDEYMQRAYKNSLYMGVGFIVLGLIGYFF